MEKIKKLEPNSKYNDNSYLRNSYLKNNDNYIIDTINDYYNNKNLDILEYIIEIGNFMLDALNLQNEYSAGKKKVYDSIILAMYHAENLKYSKKNAPKKNKLL